MSKKIGLKYPVYAKYDDSTGSPVYSSGAVMAKAMSAKIAWTKNDAKVYSDDALDDTDQSIIGGTETLGVNELTLEVQSALLGHAISNGELVANADDIAPFVGHGFYGKVKRNGVFKWRAIWLCKEQYAEPDDENETEGEKAAFKTPTITGTIMRDINRNLKREKLFDTEADAIAYLNTLAGLPVSASAGLSGLTMTGTGGTLSPAFGASTRYYTFGGLTGTSFTMTATAANHSLKLYENGVLLQNLTSGIASSAISMAAIGTRKFTLIAQENGKTSQTTEIIVVKTA
jgi:phi13 family phage major tail protein